MNISDHSSWILSSFSTSGYSFFTIFSIFVRGSEGRISVKVSLPYFYSPRMINLLFLFSILTLNSSPITPWTRSFICSSVKALNSLADCPKISRNIPKSLWQMGSKAMQLIVPVGSWRSMEQLYLKLNFYWRHSGHEVTFLSTFFLHSLHIL